MDSEESNAPEEVLDAASPASDARVETDSVATTVCHKCGCEIDVEGIDSFDEVECPDCSERVTVPAKLGPFLLVKMLGAGGMGAVYIGKDELLGRQVAIKVMLKSLGEDKEFIEAFQREAQAAAKINHPNICQIYSFGTEKGQPYIVMELISGERFDALVESGKKLDQGLVMQVGHDIAQGLSAANDEDMLHGDIKPENILLDEKLSAKLVDFGIASVAGQASEGIWGTPYYIAPEKILRKKPDGRSDMYSLGATLYHALAGKPPFEGKTPIDVVKKRLDHNPKSLASIRPDLKPEVVQVVERMLQREPAKRHPTYSSLVSDLAKCIQVCGGRKKSLSKLKKTGRIMITKRTKTVKAAASAAAASSSSSSSEPKAMPKIRVPRKSVKMPPATGKPSSPAAAPQAAAPKKPASKAPLVIFLILLALAVFGGGGYYLYDKKQKEILARRQFLSYKNAVADMGKELAAVSNAYVSVVKMINTASEYTAKASNAVETVTGSPLNYPASKTTPSPPPKQNEEAASPAASPAPPPAPKPAEPKKIVDSKGREAPVGLGYEEKKAAPPPPKQEPEPAKIDVPPPAAADPKIVQAAKSLIDDCLGLQEKLTEADERRDEAVTAFEEGRDSRNHLVAAERLKTLKEYATSFTTLRDSVKTQAERAKKRADEIEELRAAYVKAEEDKRQAEEEAERLRREAEEKARLAAEHAALVETEKGLVATAAQQALDLLKVNDYEGAVSILEAQNKDLSTDEGKAEMEKPLGRAKLLEEMKIFLAKELTDDPYAWGWIVDGRAVDVVSADAQKITTRTREAAWSEVTVRQMLHFFNKYMGKKRTALKTLGRMNVAAAVYCSLHEGGEQKSAYYAGMALNYDPNINKLAEQVLDQPESPF